MSGVKSQQPNLFDPSVGQAQIWTPVARVIGRLDRDASEHPGSMQHFHSAGLVAEVLLKLHTTVMLSAAEPPDAGPGRLTATLLRANGLGDWAATLDRSFGVMRTYIVRNQGTDIASWVNDVRTWLSLRKGRDDRDSLEAIYQPLAGLYAELQGLPTGSAPPRNIAPVDLFKLFVGIRNKTTAHRAYGPEFWSTRISIVHEASEWLMARTPLWESDLVLRVRRDSRTVGRILRGTDPSSVVEGPLLDGSGIFCRKSEFEVLPLVPVAVVDPAENSTYFANGHWLEGDSTAEFLCQSIAATTPGQGTRRIELSNYGLLPPVPESETHGTDTFNVESGRALNTLPSEHRFQYVSRPSLEDELRRYLIDPAKRHIINVRGRGGVGKTSLVLHACHDLASRPADCPYDTIIWFSARDVDLTSDGPKSVSRATSDLQGLWLRVAALLGEEGEDPQAVFERVVKKSDEAHLLILDNFETFDDQERAYAYLDEIVRPPTKVVITSRHYFRGDFQLPVLGMEFEEAAELLLRAARTAGAEPLMTDEVMAKIFERCEGHPYAMKLVASHVTSHGGVAPQIDRILRDDELLDALFRRSIDDLADDEDAVFTFLLIAQFDSGLIEPALRVVTDTLGFDLDQTVQQLILRSLIEVSTSETGFARYDMPAMARNFARNRLLAGHLLRTQVIDAVARLRGLDGLLDGRLVDACDKIARAIEGGGLDGAEAEWRAAAARVIALQEPAAWRFVAQAERAAKLEPERWEASYKRAVEAGFEIGQVLEEWADCATTTDLQIELRVQAVQADPSDYARAARVGTFLVQWFEHRGEKLTVLVRRSLATPITDALQANRNSLTAEAVACLAGLYFYTNQKKKAAEEVERGLVLDWRNRNLQELALKMKLKVRLSG